jgi:hypothetical protein
LRIREVHSNGVVVGEDGGVGSVDSAGLRELGRFVVEGGGFEGEDGATTVEDFVDCFTGVDLGWIVADAFFGRGKTAVF